jgi:phosphoribosylformimino-5-aminoimidazole carboxamide ribotide isomerase
VAALILYPAIDIQNGQCVRLLRGDMMAATVYNPDPANQAARFADLGFSWLHIVDLDGASEGRTKNRDAIERILSKVAIPVQLGGGIRDMAAVAAWLDAGVNRVILGTIALADPALVRAACREYPDRIAIGVDARAGRVATEGWARESEITAIDLARRFEDSGAAALIHTDIDRDGALTGLNLESTHNIAAAVSIPVIASGGLASLADIERLLQPEWRPIAGAICGRALYDGRLDVARALGLIAANNRKASAC